MRLSTLTLLLSAVVAPLCAQGLPMHWTMIGAETEARSYPRADPPANLSAGFDKKYAGTAERKCVESTVTDASPEAAVRAGDFVIGGQVSSSVSGKLFPSAGRGNKIWWAPLHNPFDHHSTLLVRASKLGVPGDTLRFESNEYAYVMGGTHSDSFFPTLFRVPTPGRWMLVATAGNDWGCLIVTFY